MGGNTMHTTDGGGVIVGISKPQNELQKTSYFIKTIPIHFNPKTIINYGNRIYFECETGSI
ncbi:MAG: hypothetical protein IPM38_08330 [Ignavibacteria bacterium]|nr:hypothetical protein [Ignavibacteria bacterium]